MASDQHQKPFFIASIMETNIPDFVVLLSED